MRIFVRSLIQQKDHTAKKEYKWNEIDRLSAHVLNILCRNGYEHLFFSPVSNVDSAFRAIFLETLFFFIFVSSHENVKHKSDIDKQNFN